jgi:hypothetical protein
MLLVKELPAEKDIKDFSVELKDDRLNPGRTDGSNNIPQFLRNTIAVAAQHDKNKNVARAFGVSAQEVSLLKNAKLPQSKDEFGRDVIDVNSPANTALREAVGDALAIVRQEATAKLLLSLRSITSERIAAIPKLSEVAHFAESMSRIIERAQPKTKDDGGIEKDVKFVFIVPETRKQLSDYKIIDVEQPLD